MPRKSSRKTMKRSKGKKVGSKTMKRSKGKKVSRKTMKRSKGRKTPSNKKKANVKKVSQILSSSYGLAGMYNDNQTGYKGQRVAKKDPYKKSNKKKLSKTITLPSVSNQSGIDSFLGGIESKSKSKGSWIDHVKKVYEEGKNSVPGYKYKNAMKDAKKTW